MSRPAFLLALALALGGCPGASEPQQGGAAPAQRTADAERRQVQRRLDELAQAEDAAAERLAVQSLRTWLGQPRQWRAEGYRVRLSSAPGGPALGRAEVQALIEQGKPVQLNLAVPFFPPTVPEAQRSFQDPAALEPLLDALLSES